MSTWPRTTSHYTTYLGGDDEIIPLPPELLDGFAHDLFRLAISVPFSTVKKVDATVIGCLHAGKSAFVIDVPAIGEPSAQ
jgi:hypothetical protein